MPVVAGLLWATVLGLARADDLPALAPLADQAGLVLGTAVSHPRLTTDPRYQALVARHFRAITPENALKWAPIEHELGKRDLQRAREVVAFADAHGLQVRGHALVWDLELPAWVDTDNTSALRRALDAHLRATLRELPQVPVWDVVNEALGEDGAPELTVLARRLGPEHIARAFVLADAERPDARLFYNDYGVLWPGPKASGLQRMVSELKSSGVPIDGVGLQSHLHLVPHWRLDWAGIRKGIDDLGAMGLEVHITELDTRLADLHGGEAGRLAAQALTVHQVARACVDSPSCTSLTVWGPTDADTWITRTLGPDAPLLFDAALQPKPAAYALAEALRGEPWSGCSTNFAARGILGESGAPLSVPDGALAKNGSAHRHTGRTEAWHGPRLDLSETVSEGLDWRFSVRVRHLGGAQRSEPLALTVRIEDAAGHRYLPLARAQAPGDRWTTLQGAWRPDLTGPVGKLEVYVEGPAAGVDLEVSDFSVSIDCTASAPGAVGLVAAKATR